MSRDLGAFVGRRLSPAERRNARFMIGLAGAFLVLLSYGLPMFSYRITSATTRFSGGATKQSDYPVLISGQHYAQTDLPNDQVLQRVDIQVSPVAWPRNSAWGWLGQVIGSPQAGKSLSFLLCLLYPLAVVALTFYLLGRACISNAGLSEAWIIPHINMAFVAPFSLLLAWLHQFDFSALILSLDRAALLPRLGLWVALLGTLLILGSAISLRQGTHRGITNWWALVFAAGFLIWLLTRIKPFPYLEIWNFISDGILVTLRITLTAFGFILLVSLLGGIGRLSKIRVIYAITSLYVEVIRGIPLLVQLLFIWFALPQIFKGLSNPFSAAVVGLTVCYGAYGSEIFRAGISSIHLGQMEAARSMGMTYVQAMRYVILPQAVRVILPPVGNEFVALLKDSSLVSIMAVSDLTRRGREYMSRTFLSFETWIMVALCYLVLTLFASRIVEFIELKSRFER